MNALPRLHVWLVRYEVLQDGTLPPLPTTALHGALARAVYSDVCIAPARPTCEACPAESHCAYPILFEPTPAACRRLREFGVTTEPPRPLAIAPDAPFLPTGESPIPVRRGQIVSFRLTATSKVWQYWEALRRGLERIGRQGLGPREERTRLRLVSVEAHSTPLPNENTNEVALRFVTPLRLKHSGQIASEVDGKVLAEALARRAVFIGHLEGLVWQAPPELGGWLESVESISAFRLVRVGRYSSRQGRWMRWPGLVGTLRLRGEGVRHLLPLLHFGSLAQVGKATTFGFGRYELTAPTTS
ncbi:MAG: CRISPR-associated endoribonuclease Cas6 [Candidatus Binatia bacterium]|nr:MAG: CRISPR-associated endoribonuclease Cas6 [Candidatus Binatia bacterium]